MRVVVVIVMVMMKGLIEDTNSTTALFLMDG